MLGWRCFIKLTRDGTNRPGSTRQTWWKSLASPEAFLPKTHKLNQPTPVLLQHMNCIAFLKHIAQQKSSPFMVPLSCDSSRLPPVFCGFICLEKPTNMQNPSFKRVSRCDSSHQFLWCSRGWNGAQWPNLVNIPQEWKINQRLVERKCGNQS